MAYERAFLLIVFTVHNLLLDYPRVLLARACIPVSTTPPYSIVRLLSAHSTGRSILTCVRDPGWSLAGIDSRHSPGKNPFVLPFLLL